jgi:hypothetical protein
MENFQTVAPTTSTPRRRPLFLGGTLLFLAGPALYAVQISLGQLWTAWYMPLLASLGVVLMIASMRHRRTVLRSVVLAVFALLCVGEWYLMLVATKTPAYTGPAQPGSKIPPFSATLADGTPFTNTDVEQDIRSVLVFNRGRW